LRCSKAGDTISIAQFARLRGGAHAGGRCRRRHGRAHARHANAHKRHRRREGNDRTARDKIAHSTTSSSARWVATNRMLAKVRES
jgi:hypothetical protein